MDWEGITHPQNWYLMCEIALRPMNGNSKIAHIDYKLHGKSHIKVARSIQIFSSECFKNNEVMDEEKSFEFKSFSTQLKAVEISDWLQDYEIKGIFFEFTLDKCSK